ncbi:MAG: hypothetical protein AABX29_05360 [Nanoarchaeota archaeon]
MVNNKQVSKENPKGYIPHYAPAPRGMAPRERSERIAESQIGLIKELQGKGVQNHKIADIVQDMTHSWEGEETAKENREYENSRPPKCVISPKAWNYGRRNGYF